jgi:hypothetical protein
MGTTQPGKDLGIWGGRGEWGRNARCAQIMTRRGGAGKGSGSKGCRGAEHGQACTKERTGTVAVRAALESAVQVGRGDEGSRQAEMANRVPDCLFTSAFLSTCLAMFCTSATFTATAFPSPSPPCHYLCTSHIPSLTFLPQYPHPPQIPICFPDCVLPISAHLPALTRGLSALHLSACPVRGTVGKASFCSFQRGPKRSNLTTFTFLLHVNTCSVYKLIESTYGQQKQLGTPVVFD